MRDMADDILCLFGLNSEEAKKYDMVMERFESHFVKIRNKIFERAKFNQRCQREGDSVDNFITSLYCLSEHYGYGNLRDEMIRDRIVVGILNPRLSEQLQLDPDLKLETTITKVRQREVVSNHTKLFKGLSKFKRQYTIKLQANVKPFALTTPQRVPLPLLKKVKQELNRMESLGAIRRVEEPSMWCAGMVVVPKSNGSVRICLDLTKLNEGV